MKIKKYMLENTINLLDVIPLKQKASRMRTKFKNLLIEHYQELNNDIRNIKLEYAEKDEEGNFKVDEKNNVIFKDQKSLQLDLSELLDEEVIIIEDESNKEMLVSVKYSVMDCDIEFNATEADYYDRICEFFEEIKE